MKRFMLQVRCRSCKHPHWTSAWFSQVRIDRYMDGGDPGQFGLCGSCRALALVSVGVGTIIGVAVTRAWMWLTG